MTQRRRHRTHAAASTTDGTATFDHRAGRTTPTPGDSRSAETAPRGPAITIQRGDTLWGLAERHLGAGARFVEIVTLNRDVRQSDGRALESADTIHPGWRLRLPADASAVHASAQTPATHVVETGDTLWSVAAEHLGDGSHFDEPRAHGATLRRACTGSPFRDLAHLAPGHGALPSDDRRGPSSRPRPRRLRRQPRRPPRRGSR